MSKVDKQVLQMLMDYHTYHGDTKIRLAKCLRTPRGGEVYLMRFVNERGQKYSSVDTIWHDSHGAQYATELFSEVRSEEAEMIRFVMEEDDAAEAISMDGGSGNEEE